MGRKWLTTVPRGQAIPGTVCLFLSICSSLFVTNVIKVIDLVLLLLFLLLLLSFYYFISFIHVRNLTSNITK